MWKKPHVTLSVRYQQICLGDVGDISIIFNCGTHCPLVLMVIPTQGAKRRRRYYLAVIRRSPIRRLCACLCGSGLASNRETVPTFPTKNMAEKPWRQLSRVLHSFWWSNFPTGGVAWGPCVYIWKSVRNIVTVTFRKNVISIGILENLESNCNFWPEPN